MSASPDLTGRTVLLTAPALNSMARVDWADSMFGTLLAIHKLGGNATFLPFGNIGNAVRSRNHALNHAMNIGATDVLMVDTDVSFDPRVAITVLIADSELVGVPARMSNAPSHVLPYGVRGAHDMTIGPDGLMEVRGIGNSFMRVTRAAIERMIAAYPHLKFSDRPPGEPETDAEKHLYMLYGYGIEDGKFLSDDYWFCKLFRDAGGTVHAMPHLSVTHHKVQALSGSLLAFFEEGGMIQKGPP